MCVEALELVRETIHEVEKACGLSYLGPKNEKGPRFTKLV